MTEQEWLKATDPWLMLRYLKGKASERKLRLFAVACCRRSWHLLIDNRSRQAVEVAERYADGEADKEVLADAKAAAQAARIALEPERGPHLSSAPKWAAWEPCTPSVFCWAAILAADNAARRTDVEENQERKALCYFLRDIFPFCPPHWDASWRMPELIALAQSAYDDRLLPEGTLNPSRLAILADVLEAAGCDNAEILNHCRQPGEHVRGCWVVDLLLGKE
jgi:hypothetical protein